MGGEPCALLKSKTTHAEFYCNGKLTESYLDSLSGTMYAPLTEQSGGERSMLSAADFPARISVAPGKVRALLDLEAAYGERWRESLAKWDRDTSLWKTPQCSLFEDLTESLATLPKWGMTADGVLSERVMPAHPTSGTGSGYWPTPVSGEPFSGAGEPPDAFLARKAEKAAIGISLHFPLSTMVRGIEAAGWPTPMARDHKGPMYEKPNTEPRKDYLPNAVKLHGGTKTRQTWPTPNASDRHNANMKGGHDVKRGYLRGVVKKWATPTASTGGPEPPGKTGRKLATQAKGQLNPSWVGWLMGVPTEWTALSPLAICKFRQWLHSHGKCSEGQPNE